MFVPGYLSYRLSLEWALIKILCDRSPIRCNVQPPFASPGDKYADEGTEVLPDQCLCVARLKDQARVSPPISPP